MINNYKGYLQLCEEDAAYFYSNKVDSIKKFGIQENEYIIIEDDIYCNQNNELRRINYPKIQNNWSGIIKPRNKEQRMAIDMLLDDTSTIKLITGTWGTGKTLLLASAAMQALENDKFDKIIFIRNNVQVKNTDNLGALPGTELEKIMPYVMPLCDHCGGVEGVERLINTGKLEVIPLGFLRGRSLKNSIIISTEAENLTKEHLQLLIGRVDEGSNLWLDADCRQRDRVEFEKSHGLETMIERLAGEKLFGYVHLVKSERSPTAALADKLND